MVQVAVSSAASVSTALGLRQLNSFKITNVFMLSVLIYCKITAVFLITSIELCHARYVILVSENKQVKC